MIKIARIALALGLLTSASSLAYASGLVMNDNELRNDLAWLSDRGVIHLSLSTWPLSQEEINRALKKAKPLTLLNRLFWRESTSASTP
jgi:hypothetical protein